MSVASAVPLAANSTFVIVAPPTPAAFATIVVLTGVLKDWPGVGDEMLTVGLLETVIDTVLDVVFVPPLSYAFALIVYEALAGLGQVNVCGVVGLVTVPISV